MSGKETNIGTIAMAGDEKNCTKPARGDGAPTTANGVDHVDSTEPLVSESALDGKAEEPSGGAHAQAESKEEPSAGVFSGWGFDVNSVTSNMGITTLFSANESSVGGLFSTPDSVGGLFTPSDSIENPDESEGQRAIPSNGNGQNDNLGATAANLANVATTELEQASRAAQETIGKAAEGIGRGWGTLNTFLDDMLAPESNRGEHGTDESQDIHATFRSLFPNLDTDDEVVDHYRCTLVQKYRCYLNNATPEKAFPLRGRLFVTMSNIAMYVSEDGGAFGGKAFGVNIPFLEVIKIQKGSKAMLRVVTKSQTSFILQTSFIFAEFESDTHFNGALSLLEQLQGAAQGNVVPTPSADNGTEDGETNESNQSAASR